MAPSKNAPKNDPIEVEDDLSLITDMGDDFDLGETVIHESPSTIILEAKGDKFFGQFVEIATIENPKAEQDKDKSFNQFVFRGRNGSLYALPESHQLGTNAAALKPGEWYLITLVGLVSMGGGRNDMKNIKVQHARPKSTTA